MVVDAHVSNSVAWRSVYAVASCRKICIETPVQRVCWLAWVPITTLEIQVAFSTAESSVALDFDAWRCCV